MQPSSLSFKHVDAMVGALMISLVMGVAVLSFYLARRHRCRAEARAEAMPGFHRPVL